MSEIIYKKECYDIQGAVFDVYKEIGCGFLESVYQECLEMELKKRNIPFVSQQELKLIYKGDELQQTYKPDLICYEKIIIELKAVKEIVAQYQAQLMNYLKATGLSLGLIVNFGHYPKVEIKRIIM